MAGHDVRTGTGSEPDLASASSDAGHRVQVELLLVPEGRQDVLARAEASLYAHLVVSPGGLCLGCSEPEPCRARYAALAVFNRHGVLPRRRAGIAGVYIAGGAVGFDAFAAAQTRSNEVM